MPQYKLGDKIVNAPEGTTLEELEQFFAPGPKALEEGEISLPAEMPQVLTGLAKSIPRTVGGAMSAVLGAPVPGGPPRESDVGLRAADWLRKYGEPQGRAERAGTQMGNFLQYLIPGGGAVRTGIQTGAIAAGQSGELGPPELAAGASAGALSKL